MFRDRIDAADRLAGALRHLRGSNPLILAIPRGGVPMGAIVAAALGGELDIVLVRKLPAPGNPEYAIGAVGEDGAVYCSPEMRAIYGSDYVDQAAQEQVQRLQTRRAMYTPVRTSVDPEGRVTVVVDDGSATGATMAMALRSAHARHPRRLIAALAVAPPEVIRDLETLTDEVVCLESPEHLMAVGQFFTDFSQVNDEAVVQALRQAAQAGLLQTPDETSRPARQP